MRIAQAIVALVFAFAGAFVVAGVQMLAGTAWALIAVGLILFGAAVYLRARLSTNG